MIKASIKHNHYMLIHTWYDTTNVNSTIQNHLQIMCLQNIIWSKQQVSFNWPHKPSQNKKKKKKNSFYKQIRGLQKFFKPVDVKAGILNDKKHE